MDRSRPQQFDSLLTYCTVRSSSPKDLVRSSSIHGLCTDQLTIYILYILYIVQHFSVLLYCVVLYRLVLSCLVLYSTVQYSTWYIQNYLILSSSYRVFFFSSNLQLSLLPCSAASASLGMTAFKAPQKPHRPRRPSSAAECQGHDAVPIRIDTDTDTGADTDTDTKYRSMQVLYNCITVPSSQELRSSSDYGTQHSTSYYALISPPLPSHRNLGEYLSTRPILPRPRLKPWPGLAWPGTAPPHVISLLSLIHSPKKDVRRRPRTRP
jgi:hypothetical protein